MKLVKLNKDTFEKTVKHLPFNRSFGSRQGLAESIEKYGFSVPIIIIRARIAGTLAKWVADGQNRACTAIEMKKEFYGVILDKIFIDIKEIVEFVSFLNSKSDPWKIRNYCESFAFLGNKHYSYLIKRAQETEFTLGTLAILYYGQLTRRSGIVATKIKTGKFTVISKIPAEKSISLAMELKGKYIFNSRMLLALFSVMVTEEKFSSIKFKANFIKNYKTIKPLGLDDYTNIFRSWSK